MSVDVGFILLRNTTPPDPQRIIAAGKGLGLALSRDDGPSDGALVFDVEGGGSLMIMHVAAAHPDAAHMPVGPLSPSADEAAAAPAHLFVTALGLEGSERRRDLAFLRLMAAVLGGSDALAAMLGHGVVFHQAGAFAELAAIGEETAMPVEICVDLTAARESADRMSFLTHGMQRYGREELYVTCPIRGKGALDLIYMLARWMLKDVDKKFGTGETLGRTAEERLVIQRVANPSGEGPDVIRLDMPSSGLQSS